MITALLLMAYIAFGMSTYRYACWEMNAPCENRYMLTTGLLWPVVWSIAALSVTYDRHILDQVED